MADDGIGFEPDEAGGEGHIGLENTRSRLETLCRGELRIESAPGEGAIVAMRIPKEGAGDEEP